MANYKYAANLQKNEHGDFDVEHNPGVAAPYAGIYKCVNCGDEIGIAKGHVLPSQNHSQHNSYQPIKWKLIVCAIQK